MSNLSAVRHVKLLHARFNTILPRIQTHASIVFRTIQCHQRRADCVADAVALAWKWFARLAEQGKDATRFPSVLATFAARAVKSGRRVAGQVPAKDVMSFVCQQRRGFAVGKLPDFATLEGNPLAEALADNTQTPPPDAAAFRLDFPAWLATYSSRDRAVIQDMALGEHTKELASRFGLSEGRISQKRREFCQEWEAFCEV